MSFDYEIEKDGEHVTTLHVEAIFSGGERGRCTGRPEKCYPDEKPELAYVRVFEGDSELRQREVDEMFGPAVWADIEDEARIQRRSR